MARLAKTCTTVNNLLKRSERDELVELVEKLCGILGAEIGRLSKLEQALFPSFEGRNTSRSQQSSTWAFFALDRFFPKNVTTKEDKKSPYEVGINPGFTAKVIRECINIHDAVQCLALDMPIKHGSK